MKKLNLMVIAVTTMLAFTSCNDKKSDTTTTTETVEETAIAVPEGESAMNLDSLNIKINEIVNTIIEKRRLLIKAEALTAVSETQSLLQLIESGKTKEAIEEGHRLIGKFKVLLLKDPSVSTILVDANFHKDMLISDIETVRSIVDKAKLELDNRHYQDAATLLNKVKSEIVIQNVLIPAATYPDAIKVATALLKDENTEAAKSILQQTLSTIFIEKTILPIPILKAEQFIIAASEIEIQKEGFSQDAVNLINHADYQLHLAEEMGYGKKDKQYAELYKSIKSLKDDIMNGIDQATNDKGFNVLKGVLHEFRERLFPAKIN